MLISDFVRFFQTNFKKNANFQKKSTFNFFKNIFQKEIIILLQYKHEPLDLHLSLVSLNSVQDKKDLQIPVVKMSKKGDFENSKVQNYDFSSKLVRFFK